MSNDTKKITLTMPASSFEALEQEAFTRGVSLDRLVSDYMQVHVVEGKQRKKMGDNPRYGSPLLKATDASGGIYVESRHGR